jgi:hypothetical protein
MAGKLTIRFSAASMDDHLETPIPGEAQPPGIQPSWKSAPPHPQRQERVLCSAWRLTHGGDQTKSEDTYEAASNKHVMVLGAAIGETARRELI